MARSSSRALGLAFALVLAIGDHGSLTTAVAAPTQDVVGFRALREAEGGGASKSADGEKASGDAAAGEAEHKAPHEAERAEEVHTDDAEDAEAAHSEGHHQEHGAHAGAEHGHHQEHGAHGEHHGHHHHVSEAMMTTSYLLIGFLATNFTILKLVNWGDAHVRMYTWRMMSSAISIYLAVVADSFLSHAVVWTLGKASSRDIEGIGWAKTLISIGLLLTFFGGVNVACWCFREESQSMKQYRYTASVIGGHVTAFAGISALAASADVITDRTMYVVALGSFIGLVVLRLVSMKVRKKVLGNPDPKPNSPRDNEKKAAGAAEQEPLTTEQKGEGEEVEEEEEEEGDLAWHEAAPEAEDEACCIISSYIIKEVVVKTVFAGEAEKEVQGTHHGVIVHSSIIALFVGSVIATTYAIKFVQRRKADFYKDYKRYIDNFRGTMAMSTSWLYLRLSLALCAMFFPAVDHHFREVISAGGLTGFAIIMILGLDQVADKVANLKAGKLDVSAMKAMGDQAKEAAEMAAKMVGDTKNLEKAIRLIIDSVALSVGLAWEHAFHAATSTIVSQNYMLKEHKMLARFSVAAVSFFVMVPVWLRHIVPMASRSAKKFEEAMKETPEARRASQVAATA